jgi:hypothetical protein
LLFVFFLLTIVTLLDTKVVSLIPAHDEKNSIQPYAIKFDNNFLYVNGLLWVLQVSSNNKSYLHDITEIKDFLALSRVARFYATTEQKLIHSFWNALRIRRKINQLHQSSRYTSYIYYTTQNNPWICRYRFNGKVFWFFFVSPLIHVKLNKSTVEFHTSKNILKMIKERNQSRQVLFYISNTHLYTLVCRFLNRPPPFPLRTPPFWQMMVINP